jgi:hypothetical protein
VSERNEESFGARAVRHMNRATKCAEAMDGIPNPAEFVRAARELERIVQNVLDVELREWDCAAGTAIKDVLSAFRAAGGGQ